MSEPTADDGDRAAPGTPRADSRAETTEPTDNRVRPEDGPQTGVTQSAEPVPGSPTGAEDGQ